MEDRDLARLLAWGRIGIGLAGVLMPRFLARVWTGAPQPDFPTNMIARGLGARDIAIGAGLLASLEGAGSPRMWLQAGAAADASDALGTMSSFSDLGGLRASGLLALEVGAAVVGLRLADELA
ncbi:MAG TPA: hypothetical protein VJ927_08020 [Actinomycetota bacterium]|nr:hypothetical protein [Actinomycetota bacterium]